MTKENLKENLQTKIFLISFIFCDKKVRSYKITLNKDIIPKEAFLSIGPETQFATVWDIENKKWICFSWDKIYKLKEINGTI